MPTTKTSKTHGTEVILLISHQGRVQLGYADTFPMDGIVLLQYKFPHVQHSSLSGDACGAAAPSQLRHSKNNLPQKHSQNIPLPREKLPLPTACPGTHRVIPNTAWHDLPRQESSTLCHWPQTWQGIIQVLTSPCFILQPDQDKTHHFLVC